MFVNVYNDPDLHPLLLLRIQILRRHYINMRFKMFVTVIICTLWTLINWFVKTIENTTRPLFRDLRLHSAMAFQSVLTYYFITKL